MKNKSLPILGLILWTIAFHVQAATFTVETVVDGTSTNPMTLRAALTRANATSATAASPNYVMVPPGTYNISGSALAIGNSVNKGTFIVGTGAATNTIISQDGAHRVFNVNGGGASSVAVAFVNLTITGGKSTEDNFGGGGIIAGSTGNQTLLTNCVLTLNECPSGGATTGGGAIASVGGHLVMVGCVVGGNTASKLSPLGNGGGIFYQPISSSDTVRIIDCTFTNNTAVGFGGALYLTKSTSGSLVPASVIVTNTTFAFNQSSGTNGAGGAIYYSEPSASTALTVLSSTFATNRCLDATGRGGAILVTGANAIANIINSRFVGNSVVQQSGGVFAGHAILADNNGITTTVNATNNWWGTNGVTANAVVRQTAASTFVDNAPIRFLTLSASVNPGSLAAASTSSVTASLLTDSNGSAVPAANLAAFVGLPVTASSTVGTVSPMSFSAAGTALGTLTPNAAGAGSVTVTFDSQSLTTNIAVLADVVSINRVFASPTNLSSVEWTVTFDTAVTGVGATNFQLVATELTGAEITSVTGSGTNWTVTASTGSGTGTLQLNMVNAIGITEGVTNLPFTGQTYSLLPPPVITSTNSAAGIYGVSFNYVITAANTTNGFDATDLPAGLTVDSATGVISGTPLESGLFSPTLIATNASGSGSLVLNLNIARKVLTVSGLTADSRAYALSTLATISGTPSLVGVVSNDDVTLSGTPVGHFADKNVGSNKLVTITGLTLTGESAINYSLTAPTSTASITPAPVTVTGITASNKVYDGTTVAVLNTNSAALNGLLGPDVSFVSLALAGVTGNFADAGLGAGKTVTVSGLALTGPGAGNYVITQPVTTLADITDAAPQHSFVTTLTEVGGGWIPDRFPPHTFASTDFNGDTRINLGVSAADSLANRAFPYNNSFYNEQGVKRTIGHATSISADFYMAADWGTNRVIVGLWADAFNSADEESNFATLEFVNEVGGTPHFEVFNGIVGGYQVLSLPADAHFDAWVQLNIGLESGKVFAQVTGQLTNGQPYTVKYTIAEDDTTAYFSTLFLQAYNGDPGSTYDAYFDNIIYDNGAVPGVEPIVTLTVAEEGTAAIQTLKVLDADTNTTLTTTLAIAQGALQVATNSGASVTGSGSGLVTIQGTFAQVNAALAGLAYTAPLDVNGDFVITVVTTNSVGLGDADLIGLTITPVNDAPVLAAPITGQDGIYGTSFLLTFATNTFTDVDGDILTYTASGLPPGITLETTNRTFSGMPTNAGNYTVTLVASDGELTATNTFGFSIAKAPATVILSALTQSYNATPRPVTVTTVPPGLSVDVTYAGSTNPPIGVGSYQVIGTINEANYFGAATNTLTITTARPVIALSTNSVLYNMGTTLTLDPQVVFTAYSTSNYFSSTLRVFLTSAGAADVLFVNNIGTGPGQISAGSGVIRYGGTTIGGYTGGTAGAATLQFSFNPSASAAAVQELLRNVNFTTTDANNTNLSRTINFAFKDFNNLSNALTSLAVTINRQPVTQTVQLFTVTNVPVSVSFATLLTNNVDRDNDAITIIGLPTNTLHGVVTTNETDLIYTPAADFTGSEQFNYLAIDARGATTVGTVNVTVLAPPVFTTNLSFTTGYRLIAGPVYTISTTNLASGFAATGLPAGLVVNSLSGLISGSATEAGVFIATITATNIAGISSTSLTVTVTPKALTVIGLTAANRVYDLSTTTTVSGTPTLVGVEAQDIGNVSVTGTPVGQFADKNVGLAKPVTITGLSLTGSAAANYTLTTPTTTASINKAPVTAVGITANNKPYDGNTTATLNTNSAAINGLLGPDVSFVALTLQGVTGTFASTNAAVGKTVTIAGLALTGPAAGNYSLTVPVTTLADITKATATVTLASLTHSFDGTPKSATATTVPANLAVTFTYDGSSTAPSAVGSYQVIGTVNDVNYAGSATNTLTINAAPLITLSTNSAFYTLGSTSVLDPLAVFEQANRTNFAGSTLTLTILTNLGRTDRLFVRNEGTGTNQIGVNGTVITYGGTLLASYTGGTTGVATLKVTFGGAKATTAAVQQLLRNLTLSINDFKETNLTRRIGFAFNDGAGLTNVPVTLNLVLNHAPLTHVTRIATGTNLPVTVSFARLLTNNVDPDGDAITISATNTTSLLGGTLTANSTSVTYTPPANFAGVDQFRYQATDARGGVTLGTVSVIVLTQSQIALEDAPADASANNHSATIAIFGLPSTTYDVLATDTVAAGWSSIGSITLDEVGFARFYDTNAVSHVNRFYRTQQAP